MMLYDQFFIDDLKDRADLIRIIEPYAPLKKKGENWMGCCPFHQEKTPSFSVNPQKGFYKCFGCGKGGNAFTFLMEMEGLNFPEAIRRVAEMSGVPLPEPVDDQQYQKSKQRREEKKQLSDQIIELNKIALEFWEAELQKKNAKAKAAKEYLEKRGIDEETQKQFHIGFSPDSWQGLRDHLLEKGAAIKANELTTLPFKLEQLLADPDRLARMRSNAGKMGRPHAAREVVRTLLDDHMPALILGKEAREAMTQTANGELA